jgi:hypothetical protein
MTENTADGTSGDERNSSASTRPSANSTTATVCEVPKSTASRVTTGCPAVD